MTVLAVQGGIDVSTTGDDESVDSVENPLDDLAVWSLRWQQ
jgi:hypothetical protein